MKKILFIIIIGVAALTFYLFSNRKIYKLNTINYHDITSITIDTLAQENNVFEYNDDKTIKAISNLLENRTTRRKSKSSNPINPDELFIIKVNSKNKSIDTYIYKISNSYYLEQAYNGIYRISKDEYDVIKNILNN